MRGGINLAPHQQLLLHQALSAVDLPSLTLDAAQKTSSAGTKPISPALARLGSEYRSDTSDREDA